MADSCQAKSLEILEGKNRPEGTHLNLNEVEEPSSNGSGTGGVFFCQHTTVA